MSERLAQFSRLQARRKLDAVLVFGEANIRALCGVVCDSGCLVLQCNGEAVFLTDFRYVPAVKREFPQLKVIEVSARMQMLQAVRKVVGSAARIGYEGSITAARFLELAKLFRTTKFVNIEDDIHKLRAVKTQEEFVKIAAAEALNDECWNLAQEMMRPGMTEREIARIIHSIMVQIGDGEAFPTIVCAGANAAECHHVPDDTPWHKGEPLLVDMGVKLDGVCSDMTRCIGGDSNKEYQKIYKLVLCANMAAIAAARPNITTGALDRVARDVIKKGGYGGAFGHALGHGVGYEIHEAPTLRPNADEVLRPGMTVTIEPGIYLPGKLGVRIEDLIYITETGCEVLSRSTK